MLETTKAQISYHSPTVSSTRIYAQEQSYVLKRSKNRHITYNPGHHVLKPKRNLKFFPHSAA